MDKKEEIKGSRNWLKELQSYDSQRIIDVLEDLRETGKVTDIPVLVEMLHLSQDNEVKMKIAALFSNLKEKGAIPFIVDAIQDQRYAPELKILVSGCWENGLDYSEYLPLFVRLLIENDFLVAFEAYTVIMNMEALIQRAIIDAEIDRLEEALHSASDQKKVLMTDVIDFLPSIGDLD